jgi:hypothetical protein
MPLPDERRSFEKELLDVNLPHTPLSTYLLA